MNKKLETCNASSDPQTTVHRQTSFFYFFFFFQFFFSVFFLFFLIFFHFFLFFILFSTLSVLYHPLLNSHRKSEMSEKRKLFVLFCCFVARHQLTQKE